MQIIYHVTFEGYKEGYLAIKYFDGKSEDNHTFFAAGKMLKIECKLQEQLVILKVDSGAPFSEVKFCHNIKKIYIIFLI